MAQSLAELRAREEEVAREWQWLQDALNKVARARAGEDEVHAFRLLQHQAVAVGQRRVELQMQMARLERGRRQHPPQRPPFAAGNVGRHADSDAAESDAPT